MQRQVAAYLANLWKRCAAQRHRRRLHDGAGRAAVLQEIIKYCLKVFYLCDQHLHHEAVLACDAVALDNLRGRLRQLGDF